ncbi:hypothetical protein [Thermosipho atlanticus]|nr:hypothetical protein [Thermosipho atlanticus]
MDINLKKLKNHLRKISKFESTIALLCWDQELACPKNTVEIIKNFGKI